jgi:hypothetical protein
MNEMLFVVFAARKAWTDSADEMFWLNHKMRWPSPVCDLPDVRAIEQMLSTYFDFDQVTLISWRRFDEKHD